MDQIGQLVRLEGIEKITQQIHFKEQEQKCYFYQTIRETGDYDQPQELQQFYVKTVTGARSVDMSTATFENFKTWGTWTPEN